MDTKNLQRVGTMNAAKRQPFVMSSARQVSHDELESTGSCSRNSDQKQHNQLFTNSKSPNDHANKNTRITLPNMFSTALNRGDNFFTGYQQKGNLITPCGEESLDLMACKSFEEENSHIKQKELQGQRHNLKDSSFCFISKPTAECIISRTSEAFHSAFNIIQNMHEADALSLQQRQGEPEGGIGITFSDKELDQINKNTFGDEMEAGVNSHSKRRNLIWESDTILFPGKQLNAAKCLRRDQDSLSGPFCDGANNTKPCTHIQQSNGAQFQKNTKGKPVCSFHDGDGEDFDVLDCFQRQAKTCDDMQLSQKNEDISSTEFNYVPGQLQGQAGTRKTSVARFSSLEKRSSVEQKQLGAQEHHSKYIKSYSNYSATSENPINFFSDARGIHFTVQTARATVEGVGDFKNDDMHKGEALVSSNTVALKNSHASPSMASCKLSKNQPVRPLTAYNYFFSDERKRLISGSTDEGTYDEDKKRDLVFRHVSKNRAIPRKHRKTHGKIDFKNLTREIGQRWRRLPADRKKFYEETSALDLERYRLEVGVRTVPTKNII